MSDAMQVSSTELRRWSRRAQRQADTHRTHAAELRSRGPVPGTYGWYGEHFVGELRRELEGLADEMAAQADVWGDVADALAESAADFERVEQAVVEQFTLRGARR